MSTIINAADALAQSRRNLLVPNDDISKRYDKLFAGFKEAVDEEVWLTIKLGKTSCKKEMIIQDIPIDKDRILQHLHNLVEPYENAGYTTFVGYEDYNNLFARFIKWINKFEPSVTVTVELSWSAIDFNRSMLD